MTVFKAFLKILKKNSLMVILYVIMLIFFGTFNYETNDTNNDYMALKPSIYINNLDKGNISNDLSNYLKDNCNLIDLNINQIEDSLFYREVNYYIEIPKTFSEDIKNKKVPLVNVKSSGNYEASLASMYLERYLNVLNIYNNHNLTEAELINKINETVSKEVDIVKTSKIDNNKVNQLTSFYNFANYTFLAGCVFVICIIITSFKEKNVNKRIIISSLNYKSFNRYLLFSNSLFAIFLWLLYIILSFILIGEIMFSFYGLLYIINSFLFMVLSLVLALLIGNIVHNKEAINGIINCLALGSSFLCGAFVPMELLPNSVLKFSHVLPSYYYIKNNELIKGLNNFDFIYLEPIIINSIIMIIFIVIMIILNNIISKRKQIII